MNLAIVQRKGRKAHLAIVLPGADRWETLGSCRLTIPIDGADFTPVSDAVGTISTADPSTCLHCLHLIAFAKVLEQRPELLTGLPAKLSAVA